VKFAESARGALRLGIATDEPITCSGIQTAFCGQDVIRLVWLPASEDSLLDALKIVHVDALLLDMACDFSAGIDRNLQGAGIVAPIILWQRLNERGPANDTSDGLSSVTLDKCATHDVMVGCVHAVLAGNPWNDSMRVTVPPAAPTPRLHVSPREAELINLVAEGLSNREIAIRLGLTEGSVKVYFSRLFHKLGVADRVGLILYSMQYPFHSGRSRESRASRARQEIT